MKDCDADRIFIAIKFFDATDKPDIEMASDELTNRVAANENVQPEVGHIIATLEFTTQSAVNARLQPQDEESVRKSALPERTALLDTIVPIRPSIETEVLTRKPAMVNARQ